MTKLPVRILRRMGYFTERQGIADRYLNQSGDWDNHLEQTRNFVLQVLGNKAVKNLVILGSGWLIDLPLELIQGMADNVFLYDIAHPAQVIHKIRNNEQIKAVFMDITGGSVIAAYRAVREFKKTRVKPDIQRIVQRVSRIDVDADFIVSLNMLSQIGLIINEYLIKYIPYSEDELNELNSLIQAAHIRLLTKYHSCLVTDYEEIAIDMKSGHEEVRKTVFTDIPQSGRSMTWDWNFDSIGSYYPDKRVILKVIATEIHPVGV